MTTYRSELFVSCDLTGSTAYKQGQPEGGWELDFLAFYQQFPEMLGRHCREAGVDLRLWKPIGDELVFRTPVRSEKDVAAAVRVWLAAMDQYTDEVLAKKPLNTKGGAFIGTFPGPDVEAGIHREPVESDSARGVVELNDEALKKRDNDRFVYDYFGPSFDTGFRILGQASQRHFTLSVEVALAMLRHAVDGGDGTDLVLLGTRELKGVWRGRDYPLFAIDRKARDPINTIMRKIGGPSNDNREQWRDLCEECLRDPNWPSGIYLPDSNHASLLGQKPTDALTNHRSQNNMVGSEQRPSPREESKGHELPKEPPPPLGR